MNNKNIVEDGKATRFKTGKKQASTARAGGKASGESKRKKRLLADICNMIGQMKSDSAMLEGLPKDERTKDAEVAMAMYYAAQGGDTKAATWIRDTKGESKIQVEVEKATPIDMSALGFDE